MSDKIMLAHEAAMRSYFHSLVISLAHKTSLFIELNKEEKLTYNELIRYFGVEARIRRVIGEKTASDAIEELEITEWEHANDDDEFDEDSGEAEAESPA